MGDYALNLQIRADSGKGWARKLRGTGRIPAVCYGRKVETVSVSLDPHVLERLLKTSEAGMNTLIDLKVEGGGPLDGRVALVKELQRDPASGRVLHADFYAVDLEQKVNVDVPIHLVGTAVGVVAMGGIVDHALRELELECLPGAIPRELMVDVSALSVGDSLHVRDIVLPEGVTLRSDPDLSVVSVVAPAVEEAPAAEEAAEGAVEGEPGEAPEEGAEQEKPAESEGKGE